MDETSKGVFEISEKRRRLLELRLRKEAKEALEVALIPRGENLENAYPLSFAQQRIWFLDRLDPDSALYNIPISLRLVGSLNIIALEQSLNEIVSRHEVLRTEITIQDGQPVQTISPAQDISLSVVDLSQLPSS